MYVLQCSFDCSEDPQEPLIVWRSSVAAKSQISHKALPSVSAACISERGVYHMYIAMSPHLLEINAQVDPSNHNSCDEYAGPVN